MRIGLDVMGGDYAPDAILAGGLDAVSLLKDGDRMVLVGDQQLIEAALAERQMTGDPRIEIEPTTEVVDMHETPISAIREKPNSSIVRLARLGGKRHGGDRFCDIIISAGNTGACVASAQMSMRRLPGVTRPGVAVTVPTFFGPVVMCDVGSNPEAKAAHLHQYGHMATIYAQRILGIEEPRVALMSIGEEEGKGHSLARNAAILMRKDTTLNYVGYVEGRSLFEGRADVVVTEGFTGNVVIKLVEGLSAGIFRAIGKELIQASPELAPSFDKVVKQIYAKHDYHEYGGAPLLGANGICMICHGSSEARTIVNAVRTALIYARSGVNEGIIEALDKLTLVAEGAK